MSDGDLPLTPMTIMLRMIEEVRGVLKEGDDRLRDITRTVDMQSGEIRALRQSIEHQQSIYSKIPERVDKLERGMWLIALIAAFLGVVGGGIIQNIATDMFRRAPTQQHVEGNR